MRELPTPLVPFSVFNDLLALDLSGWNGDGRDKIETELMSWCVVAMMLCPGAAYECACSLSRLPSHSHQILRALVHLCTLMAAKSQFNKMDAANLARSMAPGLMHSEVQDVNSILSQSHKSNEVFQHLIENYALYFEKSLHATAAAGNVTRMRELIQKDGLGVMGRDDLGKTVLHYAAAAGQLEMCRFLVESFPEFVIDSVDGEACLGCRPGHFAHAQATPQPTGTRRSIGLSWRNISRWRHTS